MKNSLDFPTLSVEKEKHLFKELKKLPLSDEAKENIYNEIYRAYARLVVAIAYKVSFQASMLHDLIQEGFIGLFKATKNFNPDLNVRFGVFASYYINHEMFKFITNNWSIIKLPPKKVLKEIEYIKVCDVNEDVMALAIPNSFNPLTEKYSRLIHAIENLDVRSRDIILHRWLGEKKEPLRVLAHKYNLSIEGIRKIEMNAFNYIRNILKSI